MAASDCGCMIDIQKKLKEAITCCICTDIYEDPRTLSCLHTFCMRCLSKTAEKSDRNPGDKMPCPLCREDVAITEEGFAKLPKNFFIHQLMEFAQVAAGNDNQIVPTVKTQADEIINQINEDVRTLSVYSSNAAAKKQTLEKQKAELLDAVGIAHVLLTNARDELKKVIDRHADILVRKLESMLQVKLKEIEAKFNSFDNHLASIESFQMYCLHVVEQRSSSEVCYLSRDIQTQRDELRKSHKCRMKTQFKTLNVIFTRSNVDEFLQMKNTVGNIQEWVENQPLKSPEKPSKVEEKHKEIQTLNEKLQSERQAITNLKTIIGKQTQEIKGLQAENANLIMELDNVKSQIEGLKKKNSKMKKDHNKERKSFEELQAQAEKLKALIDAEWKEKETLQTSIAKISKELDKEKLKCIEFRLQAGIHKDELDDKRMECGSLQTTINELFKSNQVLHYSIDKLTSLLEDESAKNKCLEAAIDKQMEEIAEKENDLSKCQKLICDQAIRLTIAERVRVCETRRGVSTEKFPYEDATQTKQNHDELTLTDQKSNIGLAPIFHRRNRILLSTIKRPPKGEEETAAT